MCLHSVVLRHQSLEYNLRLLGFLSGGAPQNCLPVLWVQG